MVTDASGSKRAVTIKHIVFAGILLIAFVGLGGWQVYRIWNTQELGTDAADFNLPYIGQDGAFTLSEQRDKVVVVNIWASWCDSCKEEAPMLESVYQDYQEQPVIFVGVAVSDEVPAALAYIDEFNITYPTVIDNDDEMARRYNVYGVPITFIVDRQGKITYTFFSSPSESRLRQEIDNALKNG